MTELARELGAELPAVSALRRAVSAVQVSDLAHDVVRARVAATDLEPAVCALAEVECRVADLFAVAEEQDIVLRLVYALAAEGAYLVLESPAPGDEYAQLSDIAPAVFVEECEVFEQFGIRPAGGKPLNRVLLPPHADGLFPLRAAQRRRDARGIRAPHFVQGEAFEFPFGPVRVAGWESLYLGLVTTGEEVLDLYVFMWHKHRGVEQRLVGQDLARAVFLVERADGLSAIGNGLAFCRAIESAAGTEVPDAACCTRALALELERIYNHAGATAVLCQTTGLGVGQAGAEIALEQLLRLNLAAFGHRYLFDVLVPGGVRRGPHHEALRTMLTPAADELRRVVDALFSSNSHVDRLEATGKVPNGDAQRLALVGPVARASGYSVDVRADHPYPPYDRIQPAVPTRTDGDVFARMQVFAEEIEESRRLITELLSEAGPGVSEVPRGRGAGLGWAESVRGESLAWVELAPDGTVDRARLRPASVRNWRAFDDAARSQNVFTDIPIIEASFWLTVAGFAR
jgi:Ni,Fe-hydrogenase III large subunit/Ni,Fe-hydrogenase III component G